jgi:hypothetical protein
MLKRGGTEILAAKNSDLPWMIGPGHAGIYNDEWLSFHYYDARQNGVGSLGVYKIHWKNVESGGFPHVDLADPLLACASVAAFAAKG